MDFRNDSHPHPFFFCIAVLVDDAGAGVSDHVHSHFT